MMTAPALVAIDWGTSSFRLWVLGKGGEILASSATDDGMNGLQPADYETILTAHLHRHAVPITCPIVIAGMAGAAQGWIEAPYVACQTALFNLGGHAIRVPSATVEAYILPGVRQDDPANVMRGEEIQLLGLLEQTSNAARVVAMPGTHTKWVRLHGTTIGQFQTAMTGEIFGLLSKQSVLRHTLQGSGWDRSEFQKAVRFALSKPQDVALHLFDIRADLLLKSLPASTARARLSGLLIGSELAATRDYWTDQSIALVGSMALCETYAAAFDVVGVPIEQFDAATLSIRGLRRAFQSIERVDHAPRDHRDIARRPA